jgi:hypothetical protein
MVMVGIWVWLAGWLEYVLPPHQIVLLTDVGIFLNLLFAGGTKPSFFRASFSLMEGNVSKRKKEKPAERQEGAEKGYFGTEAKEERRDPKGKGEERKVGGKVW